MELNSSVGVAKVLKMKSIGKKVLFHLKLYFLEFSKQFQESKTQKTFLIGFVKKQGRKFTIWLIDVYGIIQIVNIDGIV